MGTKTREKIKQELIIKTYFEYWKLQNNPDYQSFFIEFNNSPFPIKAGETADQYRARISALRNEPGFDSGKLSRFYEQIKNFGLTRFVDLKKHINWSDLKNVDYEILETMTGRSDSGRYPVKGIFDPAKVKELGEWVSETDFIPVIDIKNFDNDEILAALSVEINHHRRMLIAAKRLKPLGRNFIKNFPLYAQAWDLRKANVGPGRMTFKRIAKRMNSNARTTRERYCRAFELVYGRPYDQDLYRQIKKNIRKETLKRYCDICEEKKTCTVVCPDVLPFVMADWRGQRERQASKFDGDRGDHRKFLEDEHNTD